MANGGGIRRKNIKRGMIHGKGGPTEDKQPILASPGEFVIPADTVRKVGANSLRDMVAATHKPVHLARGMVGKGFTDGLTEPLPEGWENFSPEEQELWKKTKQYGPGAGKTGPIDYKPTSVPPPEYTGKPQVQTTARGVKYNPAMQAESIASKANEISSKVAQATKYKPSMWGDVKAVGRGIADLAKNIPEIPMWVQRAGLAATLATESKDVGEGSDVRRDATTGIRQTYSGREQDSFFAQLPASQKQELITRMNEASFSGDSATADAIRTQIMGKPAIVDTADKYEGKFAGPSETAQPIKNNFGADRNPAERGLSTAPKYWPGEGPKQNSFSNADVAPTGVDSSGQPSIADTNAAARAEMLAMDARTAAAGVTEGRRLDDMNLRGQQAGAAWDRQVAIERKDPQMYANAVRKEELLKEGTGRTLARDLKGMEETGANARADKLAAASRYGHELGLRGTQLTAQSSLLSHLMTNQVAKAQLSHTIGKENAKDFQDEISKVAQVFIPGKDKGPPVIDLQASAKNEQNLMRFMVNPSVKHVEILDAIQPGAKVLTDIPRARWNEVFQKALTSIDLGAATGGMGMPDKYVARQRGIGDFWGGRDVNSQIGLWDSLTNSVTPRSWQQPENNVTVRTHTQGSLPTDEVLAKLAADPIKFQAVIQGLRTSGDEQSRAIADILASRR